MRKFLVAAAATVALGVAAATPASGQAYFDVDPGGVGVQVGPLGFGVGPRYDGWDERSWRGRGYWRDRDAFAYRRGCPVVRERVETPSGRVVIRTHRECY